MTKTADEFLEELIILLESMNHNNEVFESVREQVAYFKGSINCSESIIDDIKKFQAEQKQDKTP